MYYYSKLYLICIWMEILKFFLVFSLKLALFPPRKEYYRFHFAFTILSFLFVSKNLILNIQIVSISVIKLEKNIVT